MKKYEMTQEDRISNIIVKELNASVCWLTFPNKTGVQKADLYNSPHSGNTLVAHKTCAPVLSEFIKTVRVDFTTFKKLI